MSRFLFRAIGLVSIATGTYALSIFTPPADADPGGVNLAREIFASLILAGLGQLTIARMIGGAK